MVDLTALLAQRNVYSFSKPECEILLYLLHLELSATIAAIVTASMSNEEKINKLSNGLENMYHIKFLVWSHYQNPDAVLVLNGLASEFVNGLIAEAPIQSMPIHVVEVYNRYAAALSTKLTGIPASSNQKSGQLS